MRLKDRSTRQTEAYALPEVLICIAIMVIIYGSTILAYTLANKRAEWSGYSLAAQALSIRQMEQARAAKWDTQAIPAVDFVTNISLTAWTNLDVPYSGTNRVNATNFTTLSLVTYATNGQAISVRFIKVDTVWPWRGKLFTNSIATYRGPNQ